MRHLELFKYIQEDTEQFTFEFRSLARLINNDTHLEDTIRQLNAVIRFAITKLKDEKEFCSISNKENAEQYLLGSNETIT